MKPRGASSARGLAVKPCRASKADVRPARAAAPGLDRARPDGERRGRIAHVQRVRVAARPGVERAADHARGAAGRALVIAPSQGIHTFGMAFAIDVVGIARNGVIVGVRRAVPRRRLVFMWRAFAVVELAAGTIDAVGCKIGEQVAVETGSDRDR